MASLMASLMKTSFMKTLPKLLLVLAFVLAPAFGEGGQTGEGGVVNLPCCARGPINGGSGGPPPHVAARMRFNVGPICEGIVFRLPGGMESAAATLSVAGQSGVPILVTEGLLVLTGGELDELRQGGAEALVLNIAGAGCFLCVRITFVPGGEAMIEVW